MFKKAQYRVFAYLLYSEIVCFLFIWQHSPFLYCIQASDPELRLIQKFTT
jgi:hypothetical protein